VDALLSAREAAFTAGCCVALCNGEDANGDDLGSGCGTANKLDKLFPALAPGLRGLSANGFSGGLLRSEEDEAVSCLGLSKIFTLAISS
jgi:hypothetical protein